MNTGDHQKATTAARCANQLSHDLAELVRSDNPLLSDIALAELEIVSKLNIRLERLASHLARTQAPEERP